MKYIRRVLAYIRKADETYGLFDDGDKIVVGISGGKDSMALFYALTLYGRFKNKNFTLYPIMLDLGFPSVDLEPLKEYFRTLGYELRVNDSREVYPILLAHQKEGKHIPCSICSRMKKAAINGLANELGANKVAFAHHRDDALETLYMNMVHGGRVATFEPKMAMVRSGLTFIRPLIETPESDLRGLCAQEGIPVLASGCPANGFTEREFAKQELARLYELRPESQNNLPSCLSNYKSFSLYFNNLEFALEGVNGFALKPLIYASDLIAYEEIAKNSVKLTPVKAGLETFLILKNHKIVGRVSLTRADVHTVEIGAFETSLNEKEEAEVLKAYLHYEAKKANPIYFLYLSRRKKPAIATGFRNDLPPFLGRYSLRISL